MDTDDDSAPRYIRGPKLRKRWDNMSNSTFYEKVRNGLIPEPVYPFGPEVPYWLLTEIEDLERKAASAPMPTKAHGGPAKATTAPAPATDATPARKRRVRAVVPNEATA